jgi:hypothetical protein
MARTPDTEAAANRGHVLAAAAGACSHVGGSSISGKDDATVGGDWLFDIRRVSPPALVAAPASSARPEADEASMPAGADSPLRLPSGEGGYSHQCQTADSPRCQGTTRLTDIEAGWVDRVSTSPLQPATGGQLSSEGPSGFGSIAGAPHLVTCDEAAHGSGVLYGSSTPGRVDGAALGTAEVIQSLSLGESGVPGGATEARRHGFLNALPPPNSAG